MSEAHVIATRVVLDYIRELECAPGVIDGWRTAYLSQRSYAKTAAQDILELLRDTDQPPLVVIEAYRDKMDEYACLNKFGSIMFSVAHDTAENIIDSLIGSYY